MKKANSSSPKTGKIIYWFSELRELVDLLADKILSFLYGFTRFISYYSLIQ
jgi:hypothetical protein